MTEMFKLISFTFFDFNRVNDGDAFAVVSSDNSKLFVNNCPTCTHPGKGLYTLKEKLMTLPSSYIVPKGSPLLASINKRILPTVFKYIFYIFL